MSSRIRREVELLPWPEVIGDDEQPSASEQLLERAGEIAVENERLVTLSKRSADIAEAWERKAEHLAGEVIFWHRRAAAYRRLAIVAGFALVVAGAWRLLG